MSERKPGISRRDFLKFFGYALVVACLPRDLADLGQSNLPNQIASDKQEGLFPPELVKGNFPSYKVGNIRPQYVGTAKEEDAIEGIKVIDNIGINIQGEKVDVIVDTSLVKASILIKAMHMINPKYLPDLEKALDRLVISFGARPYHEVVETVLALSGRRDLIGQIFGQISKHSPAPYGAFFRELPLIYLNLKAIIENQKGLIHVWDHEIAHFIYNFDPDKKENSWESVMERTTIQSLLSLLSSSAISLALYSCLAKRDRVKLINYIKANKEEFEILIYRGFIIMMLGFFLPAQHIHYRFFDDDEILAREAVKIFPTPQEFFDEMIKIFLSFSDNPK